MTFSFADAVVRFHERMRPHLKPLAAPPPANWAFWKYDQFPYFLSAKVRVQHPEGQVEVEGYSGMRFRPFYMATGQHGEDLHKLGKRLSAAYRIHQECARNAAGNYADELLTAAGLPTSGLGLRRTGWQGDAYKDIFKRQMEQEQ